MANYGLKMCLENFISHLNITNEELAKSCSILAVENEQLHSNAQQKNVESDIENSVDVCTHLHLTSHLSLSQSLRNGRMVVVNTLDKFDMMCSKYNDEQKQKYMDNLKIDSYTLLPYHTLEKEICIYKERISATKEKGRAIYQNSQTKYLDLQNHITQLKKDINSLEACKEEIRKQKKQFLFKNSDMEHTEQSKLKELEHIKSEIAAQEAEISRNENTTK